MYDLIGDIHGHFDPLVRMLETLGYDRRKGVYAHPHRQVIFLGDWVDRGPRITEVLRLVRGMIEAGSALAVLGNHEWNAIGYHTRRMHDGSFFREHLPKNVKQHSQTILQMESRELHDFVDWFKSLPLWLELDGLRVVHACWDERAQAEISNAVAQKGLYSDAFMEEAWLEGTTLSRATDATLKGKEIPLPEGEVLIDKDGHPRNRVRARWFDRPDGLSFAQYALPNPGENSPLTRLPVPQSVIDRAVPYDSDWPPVFLGHYWLRADHPERLSGNVACLDYSVAGHGMLCAYRWDGEQKIDNAKFVTVPATD